MAGKLWVADIDLMMPKRHAASMSYLTPLLPRTRLLLAGSWFAWWCYAYFTLQALVKSVGIADPYCTTRADDYYALALIGLLSTWLVLGTIAKEDAGVRPFLEAVIVIAILSAIAFPQFFPSELREAECLNCC